PTRSTRAVTRSPGMAPPTSTIWPFTRAIIRPPAAGFSTVSTRDSPGAGITLELGDGSRAERPPRFGGELGIERGQPLQQRLARRPANAPRVRPRGVQLARSPVDQGVEFLPEAADGSRGGQSKHDALQVGGQRCAGRRFPAFALRAVARA